MSVRLSEDEAWAFIARAHTGTVSTVRRDGWPISLPIWFVVRERLIYLWTPERSKKVARVRHDERACFQVESGEQWRDLSAVIMPVRASVVEDQALADAVYADIQAKYAGFELPLDEVPEATRKYYDVPRAVIALEPTGRILSWDNSRVFQ